MGTSTASIVGVRAQAIRGNAAPENEFGCLLELETNQGCIGTGIGVYGIAESALNLAETLLIGQDPRSVVALWSTLCEHLRMTQGNDLDIRAAAALDMALWDLKARLGGMPLWKSLCGSRPRAFACLNIRALVSEDEHFRKWISNTARDYAFRAAKLRTGQDTEADLRRLEIMHTALSNNTPTPNLLISTAKRWPLDQAIPAIAAIEQRFDLVCVQDSTSAWSSEELKQASSEVFAAICIGAKHHCAQGLFTALDHNDFDILTIDPAISGITGSLQIAEAAFGFELPVILAAGPGNMGAQLASVMPTVMYLEVDQPDPEAGPFCSDVRIEGGWAVAGDKPGHGIAVKSGALE